MKTPAFFQRSELTATLWLFRREFLVVGIFSAVTNLLMLTPTIYMLQVYDRYLMSLSDLTLVAVSLITLFLFCVAAFAEWSRSRLLVRVGVKLDENLNNRVFNASFDSQLSASRDNPTQSFQDLTNIRQFLTGNGIFAFFDTPWTPIYLLVLFMLHPWLGVLSVVFAVILTLVAVLGHRVTKARATKASEAQVAETTYLHGKLRNAEVIESLGMLTDLRRRWLARHEHHLLLASDIHDRNHRMQALSKFVRYSQQSLMLGAGALLVIQGEMSVGAMIAANVLMGRALQPIDLIVGSWAGWLSARESFERLETLLAQNAVRQQEPLLSEPKGEIRLVNLLASAPSRSVPILKSLNITFPAGETVGIVGPSGSGKSTLARCLVGIWPGTEGEILLDGVRIGSLDREELGPHIGYLPQDIELFEGTISENIARFREVDPDKVIEAAQRAGVHDMILRLPGGYDTPMGLAGGTLSGGQRQRIGLARAMYGNPNLVVLDEPNSNLDDQGDAALLQAVLDMKSRGKSVFLITHRPQILNVVDRILVIQEGQVFIYGPRQQVISTLQQAAQSQSANGANPAPQPA